jgi:acyl-CoA thioester hydrolase
MTRFDVAQAEQLSLYHRQTIPEEYLDEMGHMNVRWYTALFSCGAGGLCASVGMTPEHFKSRNDGSFALKQFVHYLAEVHAGQTVAIRTRFLGRSEKRLHVLHFMINESTGVVAATMEVLFSYADLDTRRTAPFPPEIAANIDALIVEHAELEWDPRVCGVIQA